MSDLSRGKTTALLSTMMFIQFFIWGAWYTMIGQWLSKIGLVDTIGWVYTVGPIAAVLAPLFLGMVADRFFASQKVLSVIMVIGGVAMLLVPKVALSVAENWSTRVDEITAGGQTVAEVYGSGFLGIFPPIIPEHLPFIGLLFLHMLCYMPTLGLTNTIAFRNIQDSEKQFPLIRVWGTIGWIVAGAILGYLLKMDETPMPLYVTGAACLVFAAFSLMLPNTPPPSKGQKSSIGELLGFEAAGQLLKHPPYVVFILASMLICIPLAGYYALASLFINHAGFASAGGVMIWGQVSEIVFMLLIPFFFARLGVKWMLAVGMLAWVVRYLLFSMGAPEGVLWMIFVGILLHGICYDFFFVTGFIYTDKRAPEKIRAQAQGFLVLMTQGLGLGLGAPIMQRILNANKAEDFDALQEQAGALREQAKGMTDAAQSSDLLGQASDLLLKSIDWKGVWFLPAMFALGILILFVLLFRDKKVEQDVKSSS